MQKLNIDQCAENKCLLNAQPQKEHLYITHHPRLKCYLKREGVDIIRSRGQGGLEGNRVFWPQQHRCTRELTAAVAGCAHKIKPVSTPEWRGRSLWVLTPNWGAMNSWASGRRKVGIFFKGVTPTWLIVLKWVLAFPIGFVIPKPVNH